MMRCVALSALALSVCVADLFAQTNLVPNAGARQFEISYNRALYTRPTGEFTYLEREFLISDFEMPGEMPAIAPATDLATAHGFGGNGLLFLSYYDETLVRVWSGVTATARSTEVVYPTGHEPIGADVGDAYAFLATRRAGAIGDPNSTIMRRDAMSLTDQGTFTVTGEILPGSLRATPADELFYIVDGNVGLLDGMTTSVIADFSNDVFAIDVRRGEDGSADLVAYNWNQSFIFTMNPDGTGSTSLAIREGSNQITEVVIHRDYVYWLEDQQAGFGSVLRRVKHNEPGAMAELIWDSPETMRNLRVTSVGAFWIQQDDILGLNVLEPFERPDLRIVEPGIEVIQSIQDTDDPIPLIANKPTTVRVYAETESGVVENVPFVLEVRDENDVLLDTLRPANGLLRMTPNARRTAAIGSVNFLLPRELAEGQRRFTAKIDQFDIIVEQNETNNEYTSELVSFIEVYPMCIDFRRVRTANPVYTTDDPTFWPILRRAATLLPVPRIIARPQSGILEEPNLGCSQCPFEMNSDADTVIFLLALEEMFDFEPAECGPGIGLRCGMLAPDVEWGTRTNGRAWAGPANVTRMGNVEDRMVYNQPSGGVTLAHEIFHNFGGLHASCDGESFTDPFWPFECDLDGDTTSDDRLLGYDYVTNFLIDTDEAAAFMTYNARRWTTRYHWAGLLNSIPGPGPRGGGMPLADNVVLIAGLYDPASGGIGMIATEYDGALLDQASADRIWLEQQESPQYGQEVLQLELEDAMGGVATHAFKTIAPCCQRVAGPRPFFAITPSAGTLAELRIVNPRDSSVLTTISPPTTAPAAPVFSVPASGTLFGTDDSITVTWSGATPGDGELRYALHYSNDGGATWTPLYHDLFDTTVTISDSKLPGSLGSSMFRVIASNGFKTTASVSDPFMVANRTPSPGIMTPQPGQVFQTLQQFELEGDACDPETFDLPESAFHWTLVGPDDPLEFSGRAPIVNGGLPQGVYTATLTVTDPVTNGTGSRDVAFVVGGLISVPADADSDGIPDDMDNCMTTFNPSQSDLDGDGVGDACTLCQFAVQADSDGDGIADSCDPCPNGRTLSIGVDGNSTGNDIGYPPLLAIQTNLTSMDDNTDGTTTDANGSELNAITATIGCDTLYIFLRGNLHRNLELFIDSRAGGQQTIDTNNPFLPSGALDRMADQGQGGLTFETGFEADFYLGLSSVDSNDGRALSGEWAELGSVNGAGFALGETPSFGDGSFLNAPSNAPAILATIDNRNTDGVLAGLGLHDGDPGVPTGIEIAIPLDAIGLPACDVQIIAFINEFDHGSVSNQIMPPLDGVFPALGDPRLVDFSTLPGDQSLTIERQLMDPGVYCDTYDNGDGTVGVTFEVNVHTIDGAIQWSRDGVPLSDNDPRVSGSNSSRLLINPVQAGDAGLYEATMTSSCGTVVSDKQYEGLPTPACLCEFDGQAGVTISDLLTYLSAWFVEDPIADIDGQPGVEIVDLLTFLQCWFVASNGPCP